MKLLFAALIVGFVFSCSSDPYLYDTPGFGKNDLPRNPPANPNGIMKVVPDYYYRQQNPTTPLHNAPARGGYQIPVAPVPAKPYNGSSGTQQYYYPQGQGHIPQARQGRGVSPGSRFYSNPYAIPPSGNAYPYYDSDQYYTPPIYYNNVEPLPGNGNPQNTHYDGTGDR